MVSWKYYSLAGGEYNLSVRGKEDAEMEGDGTVSQAESETAGRLVVWHENKK